MSTQADSLEKPPKELYKVADYLLSDNSGLRKREGIVNGTRVSFFKGKSALNALIREKDKKNPFFETREEAIENLELLLDWGLIVRVDRSEGDPRLLRLNHMQNFSEEYYFAWIYQGSKLRIILGGIGLVLIVLAGVMFPLWPLKLRILSWYLSMAALGFLGLLFVIAIIRLIIYVITIFSHPPGLWIFPNLFEDVGFFESFVPFYAWEVPKAKNKPSAQVNAASASEDQHIDSKASSKPSTNPRIETE
ncbi:hypothetical protein BB561_003871 [Smittium simulii]|uniref:Translocation protein SEC62 n=1 Tax=Smittium simulii TaxID=133385 RepID=A0A2T9YJ60_9FUNG|nr:hypothetical protein BB561_003871 [Smittium simulii]